MAYNFPNSPSNADTVTVGGITYTYNSTLGVWSTTASGGGGSSTFVGLSDTPANFSGAGGKTVKVNSGASALEFVTVSGGGSGSGVTNYANFAAFPGSPSEGDLAYAEDTNALYIYDGSEWDRISSGNNEVPEFTTSPAASYTLATDGSATSVTVAATDPEGFDITYSHDTSPSSQNQATISNSGGTFTITPSTNTSYAGNFNLRFKASDGVHTSSKTALVTLGFSTEWFGQYYDSSSSSFMRPRDVAVDSNDNIYVVGQYRVPNTADGKGYISKVDKYGALIWIKTLESTESGAGDTDFLSIVIDGSDNIYVAGYYIGSDEFLILAKYNTSGVVQLAKKYVSSGQTYNQVKIAIAPNNTDIYMSQRVFSNAHMGGTGTAVNGVANIFKVNTSGVIQWKKAVGQNGHFDQGVYYNMAIDSSSSYVYLPSRANLTNQSGGAGYYYPGIIALNASNGSIYFKRYMNDDQYANVGGLNPQLFMDGNDVVAMFQPYASTWPASPSAITGQGLGLFHVGHTGATSADSNRVIYMNATDNTTNGPYFRLDAYGEGGRIIKDGNNFYIPLKFFGTDKNTVGTRAMFAGLQKTGTSYAFDGQLYSPSNTAGGGIAPASYARTSEGRVVMVCAITGDPVASGTTENMGILSFDIDGNKTNSSLGVNNNITLTTAMPSQMTVVTNTAHNFLSDSDLHGAVEGNAIAHTVSDVSHTAATPTTARDWTDVS
jgi:hypothetical protein